MRAVFNQRDVTKALIDRLEDLPDFELMTEDEFEAWWLTHEVSADVLEQLPEGNLENDLAIIQNKKRT